MKNERIRIGCCGFRRSRAEYARQLSTVEVQHTFYYPPQIETLRRWRQEMPEEFEFTLKAWQLITHEGRSPTYRRVKGKISQEELDAAGSFRPTPVVHDAWRVTRESAEALDARYVLFQLPASFTPSDEHLEDMREFFRTVDRGGLRFCWEPRGEWPEDLVGSLCEELDLIHVVDPFFNRTTTPDDVYFRLHGRTGFRYTYEDFELEEILSMLPSDARSYIFFNNVRMIEDAVRCRKLADRVG
jgi:uncharacterized protein YecE (DUF72 family)